MWGRGVYFGSATLLIRREQSFSAAQFWGFTCIYAYTLLTQNDQIRRGNTYGEGRVFRSITPLHLHKCIMRFVSVSCVSCYYLLNVNIQRFQWLNMNTNNKWNCNYYSMTYSAFHIKFVFFRNYEKLPLWCVSSWYNNVENNLYILHLLQLTIISN